MKKILDAILDTRYSPDADPEEEARRVLRKIERSKVSGRADADERHESAVGTAGAFGALLTQPNRGTYADAVCLWYQGKAYELCMILARLGVIDTDRDRVGGVRLSDFLARNILATNGGLIPRAALRDHSTVARYIRTGGVIREAIKQGIDQRTPSQMTVNHRIEK